MDDRDFLVHIIGEICNYAVKNNMEPDDTLQTVADNITTLLKVSTFNHWAEDPEGGVEDDTPQTAGDNNIPLKW